MCKYVIIFNFKYYKFFIFVLKNSNFLQQGQTPLSIAHKLGYISVVETLKVVTTQDQDIFAVKDDKYRVQAPEMMHETFMSDSEDEGGNQFFYVSV